MFYSFRVTNRNLSTFSAAEKKQITDFQKFINQKPDSFCCVCMKVLYPEQRKYRYIKEPHSLPCLAWKLQPMVNEKDNSRYLVCGYHLKTEEDDFPRYEYPGLFLHLFNI